MKKVTLALVMITYAIAVIAQTPQAFKYQAVARDNAGNVLANQNVSFQISILEGSIGGIAVFVETHNTPTNEFGLVNLEIGNGIVVTGIFEEIDWGNGLYFLQTEMDETGGAIYQLMGISQLLSVPYSLYSESTGDTTRWKKNNDDLYYNNGNIGIGTDSPSSWAKLDVKGNLLVDDGNAVIRHTDATESFLNMYNTVSDWELVAAADNNRFDIRKWGGVPALSISDNNFIGIGTTNPSAKLDVRGIGTDDGAIFRIGNSDGSHRLTFFPGRENDPNPFIQWKEGDPLRFSTDEDSWSEKMRITSDGSVAVGTQNPHFSAIFEMESTEKGMLISRMTYAEIVALETPADGLTVYNTDDKRFYFFDEGAHEWKEIAIGTGTITPAFICGYYTLTDSDGNIYYTVQIGTQCWMAANLETTKYNDGTEIPHVTNDITWLFLSTPGYCWYNNDQVTYGNIYGALYNWYTVETGILCPTGWHVPTDDEWTTLINYLGGQTVAGGKLKETGITHWIPPNTGATNETGFTAFPGGRRTDNGTFNRIGVYGHWWSATNSNISSSWYRYMYYNTSNANRYLEDKRYGFSVRCLKD